MKIYIRCKEWKSMQDDIPVRGTEIQSYLICHRQTWLLVHQMNPDSEDENIEIGRFLHEYRHGRNKKEIQIGAVNIDIIKRNDEQIVVQEVKKSSKAKESARYQLLYYLWNLKQMGIEAKGELLFSEEKKREVVLLTEESIEELQQITANIRTIAGLPVPPKAKKIGFCKQCAYREFCWAGDVE